MPAHGAAAEAAGTGAWAASAPPALGAGVGASTVPAV
ncbi:hypothetical protein SAMN05216267_10771, partial [Actinacidiphila rubida]